MRRPLASLLFPILALLVHPAVGRAQDGSPERFGIKDNSFLVEEAFNQEAGIFQNIFVMTRGRDGLYEGSLTQEWPVASMRHQVSFTMPFSAASGNGAMGDLLLNYRLQVWDGAGRLPAFSPRLSLVVPTSAARRSMRESGLGWQINMPFSRAAGPIFFHWNAGATFLRDDGPDAAARGWSNDPFVSGSAIGAITPMFNVVVESMVAWETDAGVRERRVTLSPGFRQGWNLGSHQLVLGLAVPVTWGGERETAVLSYVSYELPFARR